MGTISSPPRLPEALRELRELLGPDRVTADPVELAVFECDGLTLHRHPPDAVVYPTSTAEVSQIAVICSRNAVPFLARGAGTGLSGGAVASLGGVIVQTSRMNSILAVDIENELAVVQPGVINSHLSQRTRGAGLHFAPDPSSQKASTIGGNVAENSGGPHTLKYGVTAAHILGLTIVLPDGRVAELGGRTEDTSGYDLARLFIGSEGTLGITTEITVRLTHLPEETATLLAAFPSIDAACRTVSHIIRAGVIPAALEMIDRLAIEAVESHIRAGFPLGAAAILLVELDGPHASVEADVAAVQDLLAGGGASEVRRSRDETERTAFWRGRKEAVGAVGKLSPAFYTNDGVVPRSRLPEILQFDAEAAARHGLRVAHVCHAGDGNIHPLILYNPAVPREVTAALELSEDILHRCLELGGSITGEHGVGTEKIGCFRKMFGESDEAQMIRLRNGFNPLEILNPGKIFPTGARCGEARSPISLLGGTWL